MKRVLWTVIVLVLVIGRAEAANYYWAGGTNDWTTENWLDAQAGNPTNGWPGQVPANADYAYLYNDGEVHISDGDLIDLRYIWGIYADSPAIIQSGGTNYLTSYAFVGKAWSLTGGLIGGTGSIRLYAGGSLTQDGGKLGDRDENSAHNFGIKFQQGQCTLDVRNGVLRPHNIEMDQGATDGLLRITGTNVDLMTIAGMILYPKVVTSTATVEFVFSDAGISTVVPSGGSTPNFRLDDGATLSGNLRVDVSAYVSDGTTPFTLFDYIAGRRQGEFGAIDVVSNGDTLLPGTPGSLNRNEYSLTYTGGDGSDIVLYFNNPPPLAGTAIIVK